VRGTDLHAYARCTLGHDGKTEADHIDAH
jgi:hypothetical protein